MKAVWALVLGLILLAGCGTKQAETMVLLDEKIAEVKISKSKGLGGMNEDTFLSLKDKESLSIMEKTIKTAIEQPGKVDNTDPDYDVMVEYASAEGDLPTHGLHLWLDEEMKQCTFMYIADDTVYLASEEMTQKLKDLILQN